MATSATGTPRPGLSVGPTSEFSLFFRVKPGEGASLRAALRDLQDTPGYRPGRLRDGDPDDPRGAVRAVRRRHPAGVHHQLRRPVGRLHGGLLHLRADAGAVRRRSSATSRATTGCRTWPRVQGVRPGRRADRGRVRPQLRRHGQGDPEGAARERGLPAGARPPAGRGGARSTRRCSRCWTRPPTSRGRDGTPPCRTTSPGRAPWPTRSRTSPTSTRSRARSARITSCSS